ncbi:MAG: DNA repair protein RadC [Candidatus Omnitrophota bacterium]
MGQPYKVKIKDLPKVERPREKLMQYGSGRLSNTELLAIILGSGRKGENVIDLANKILKKFKAENLPHLTFSQMRGFSGLGPVKACQILACFELGKRLLKDKVSNLYLKSEDVWKELRDLRDNKKEHFVIFYLDSRNQEIKKEVISVGSLSANLVHPREVFEPAVKNLAAQVILAHNHPSGDPEPSEDDLEITKRLVAAGKLLGIEVIDHIIVVKDKFFSFKDKGLLQKYV